MIVIIPELDKQSHMISLDRNRDPDSNYGGKYKEEAKHARGTQETLTVNIYNIDSDHSCLLFNVKRWNVDQLICSTVKGNPAPSLSPYKG